MPVKFPMLPLTGLLLLAAAPLAAAQPALPDPVAPAVIGRPIDEILPLRAARKPAAKPRPAKKVTAAPAAAPRLATAATAIVPAAVAPAAAQPAPGSQRAAKAAVDDQTGAHAPVADNVGTGSRIGGKRLAPGAYFNGKVQALVRQYYAAHPAPGRAAECRIGDPVPPGVKLTGVPDGLRAALPKLPPGHQYVQLGGEVVLVAVGSRMVVDGISRGPR